MSHAGLRFHDADALDALVRAFEEGHVEAGGFSHRAHLAVALSYLERYGLDAATERMRDGLLAFLRRSLGDEAAAAVKYRETITVFWLRLLAAALARMDGRRPLFERVNALLERYGDAGIIRQYYSEARLYSQEARERFVEPDLEPLPPIP